METELMATDAINIAKRRKERRRTAPTRSTTIRMALQIATTMIVKIILPAHFKDSAATGHAKEAKPATAASLIAENAAPILYAATGHAMRVSRARVVKRIAAHVLLNPSAGMSSVMEQKPVIRVKEIAGNAKIKCDAGME